MKKLNKLQINTEKLMKDEELMTLRGGYGGTYDCYNASFGGECIAYLGSFNTEGCYMAKIICWELYSGTCVPGC